MQSFIWQYNRLSTQRTENKCICNSRIKKQRKISRRTIVVNGILKLYQFANLGSTLQNTFAAGNRVLDILDEEPVTDEITGKNDVIFSGAKAENVSFPYGNEQILSNLSLEILKDKIIGIVGRSGSGKSTLLKLFMRFWAVQKGEVKISDENIDSINTKNLREIESFVTQETHLFKDSIKNNIKIVHQILKRYKNTPMRLE